MYFYKAYNLRILSDIYLPELIVDNNGGVSDQADVAICLGEVVFPSDQVPDNSWKIQVTQNGVYLFWEDIGKFLVRGGREIIVDPCSGTGEDVLRLFILGTTLAMLLHQRGQSVVLHAGAAVVSGKAVGFLGDKGMGKSTTVAALHARGHRLLVDDILAIDLNGEIPQAISGFPHMKLWPDAAVSIEPALHALPKLRPEFDKRGHRVEQHFCSENVPVGCFCVLEFGDSPSLELMKPQDAFTQLMANWYGARFGQEVLEKLGLAECFLQCTKLANTIPVFRLTRTKSLDKLPEALNLIEAYITAESCPPPVSSAVQSIKEENNIAG